VTSSWTGRPESPHVSIRSLRVWVLRAARTTSRSPQALDVVARVLQPSDVETARLHDLATPRPLVRHRVASNRAAR
jgi:hypothetical protein